MKSLSCFVVGLLILSGFAALGVSEEAVADEKTMNLQFLEPEIVASETYVELNVEGASARLYSAGKPILPMYTTTMSFPFGTKIVDIECETQEVESIALENKIVCAPQPVLKGMEVSTVTYERDKTIYESDNLFPDNWFSYSTGGGLNENNAHRTFLTIRVYPVRYNSAEDTIYYVKDLDLKITYKEPENSPFPEVSEYDLVIIAPSEFSSSLETLINHKNDMGVNTILKTTDEIYDEYTGVDKPEQIKYFIKDALETWNMSYVLLVGGLKSYIFGKSKDDVNQGTEDWHVPVRYTNLRDSGGLYDPGFVSDLYYADIYDSEGNFSSWDSDDDGVFAKWDNTPGKDVIDFYPDVIVGRLACRNKFEIKIMTNKIVKYEQSPADPSWYNKMIVLGGDSHDDSGTDYLEGELVVEKVLTTYMDEFDGVRLYASYRESDPDHTPTPENIIREISAGAGHILFDGHASPASWTTHWPGEFSGPESWTGGIKIYKFPQFKNGDKLPVVVVGGCHNSQFNLTVLATIKDKDNSGHTWTYGAAVPECWSWWFTRKIGGGSIATLGNTGLGYGTVGEHGDLDGDGNNEPDALEALGGYQEIQFYKTFDEGFDILGEVWKGSVNKYLETYPGMADQTDAKTIEQWPILGDPSLKIGGYPE